MKTPIYLDYAATTPIDAHVIEKMLRFMSADSVFGNPASSGHPYGWQAAAAVDEARGQLAEAINADQSEIVWTSGATESINLALQGAATSYQHRGRHIITMQTEHKAVLDTCAYLETQGFQVSYLKPGSNGLLDIDVLKNSLRDDTILVSVMYVNNETGVTQDISEISDMVKANGSLMHVDAVQALGKIVIDLEKIPIDLLSVTAHKTYGPKGVGALFVRNDPSVNIKPLIYGGGHEQGLRSGTLATHQIVGFAEAVRLALQKMPAESTRIQALHRQLWSGIQGLPGVSWNGEGAPHNHHILNVSFAGHRSDQLMKSLPQLAVAAGSACTSQAIIPSHVLRAMGLSDDLANSALRFSLGQFTNESDVEKVVCFLGEQVQ